MKRFGFRPVFAILSLVAIFWAVNAGPPPTTLNTWRMLTQYAPGFTTRCSVVYNNSYYLFPEGFIDDWNSDPRMTDHAFIMDDILNFHWRIEYTTGIAPEARDSYCNIVIGDRMYYFGGITNAYLNDFYYLDMKTFHWTRLFERTTPGPSPRRHTRCFDVDGYFHLFSGIEPVQFATDMWKYDHVNNVWIRIPFSTDAFPFMVASVYAFYNRFLYIYSGLGGDSTYSFVTKEFWGFNYDTRAWTKYATQGPKGGEIPGAYVGAFTLVGNLLYFLHGIQDYSQTMATPNVYALNLDTKEFVFHEEYSADIVDYPFTATKPIPRSYTTASTFGKYVVLSSGEYNCADDSMWVFDTVSNQWVANSLRTYPMGRVNGRLVKISESEVAMFGGKVICVGKILMNDLWVYNIDTNAWTLKFYVSHPNLNSPKSYPPPTENPTLGYYNKYIYVIGGQPEVAYPVPISFRYNLDSSAWEWFSLPSDAAYVASMNNRAWIMIGSSLISWGGQYNAGATDTIAKDTVTYLDVSQMTSSSYAPDVHLPGRYQSTGFTYKNKFCIQGGFNYTDTLFMDIWCHNKVTQKWEQAPGSADTIEPLSDTYFVFAGVGILAAGKNQDTDGTYDIWLYDFGQGVWMKNVLPDIRLPQLFAYTAVVLKNWLVLFSGKTVNASENRVIGFDIGSTFCIGETNLSVGKQRGTIGDGSGSFSYVPFSNCAWEIEGTNNLVVTESDIDSQASLTITSVSTCGDRHIYVDNVSKGLSVTLTSSSKNSIIHIPGEKFIVKFVTSSNYLSQGGFQFDYLFCPQGFEVDDLKCKCPAQHYITPSGECSPCESGLVQPYANKHYCYPSIQSQTNVEQAIVPTGDWKFVQESLPSCGYSKSVTINNNIYFTCVDTEDSSTRRSRRQMELFMLKSPVTISWSNVVMKGDLPPPRTDFCLVVRGNAFYLIGGKELTSASSYSYVFNTVTSTWTKLKSSPVNYIGHVCVDSGSLVYIHGGEKNQDVTNEMYSYNPSSDLWTSLSWSNSPALSNHAGWFANGRIYVMGGTDGVQEYSNVYSSMLTNPFWSDPFSVRVDVCVPCYLSGTESCKIRRQAMGFAEDNSYIYIYGGLQGRTVFRDLLVIHKSTVTLEYRFDYSDRGTLPLTAPPQVYGAALGVYDRVLYMFGGENNYAEGSINSLWTFDLEQNTWIGATSVLRPLPRSNFASTSVNSDGFLIFGGLVTTSSTYLTNDMWMFNSTTSHWIRIFEHQSGADVPIPRAECALVFYDNAVYVFGGEIDTGNSPDGIWYADISVFLRGSLEDTITWSRLPTTSSLGNNQHLFERASFSYMTIGSNVYVWGGHLIIEFDSAEDYKAFFSVSLTQATVQARTVSGDNPVPRVGHATVNKQGDMCIFGGYDFRGRILSDVWCIKAVSGSWSKLSSKSTTTLSRSYASASLVGNYMFVHGGFDKNGARTNSGYLWSFDKNDWMPASVSDVSSDIALSGHRMDLLGNAVYVFGGHSDSTVSDELIQLNPGICNSNQVSLIQGTRMPKILQDPSNKIGYPPGTNCKWFFANSTTLLINATLNAGDKMFIYNSETPTQTPDVTLSSSVTLFLKSYTKPGLYIQLISGKSSILQSSSSLGSVSIQYAACPTNALSSTTQLCSCPRGTFENTQTNSCDKCKSNSNDPACADYKSDDSINIAAIAGGAGGGGALILILVLFGFKKYQDKLKHMQSREQALYMHVKFSDLDFGRLLGAGSFGEVFAGTWRGTEVAIKKLNFSKITKEAIAEFDHEVSVMVELRHPNLVLYMAACVEPPNLCIVSELMQRGSLYDALHDERLDIDLGMKLSFLIDGAKGLQYLHLSSPPILHRDLKSPNLLLDGKWNLKISDFGLSGVSKGKKDDSPPGTLFWMAPEVVQGQEYTIKSDIYSYAIIMWEVFTRKEPYTGEIAESVTLRVALEGFRPPVPDVTEMPTPVKDLMVSAWSQNAQERPEFSEIIKSLNVINEEKQSSTMGSANMGGSMRANRSTETAPTGKVALVFTDVQGSTTLWEQHSDHMGEALALHNEVIRGVISRHKGYEVKTEGDAFMVTFSSVKKAVLFALQAQEMLVAADWPASMLDHPAASKVQSKGIVIFNGLRVRMGVHWGEPICKEDPITGRMDYFGQVVNKAARVGGFPKGGQVVISDSAYEEIENDLEGIGTPRVRDLGEHTLKGISVPVRLYEVLPLSLSDRVLHFEQGMNSSNSLSPFSGGSNGGSEAGSRTENDKWQIEYDEVKLLGKELGAGSFGTVFLGTYMGEEVAVKKFMKQKMPEKQYFSFLAEIMILREVNHPNILRFCGACIKQPNICLLLEYAPLGSLRDMLNSKTPLNQAQQVEILSQVADAMTFLHGRKPPIIHRDLKSANVLVMSLDPIKAKIGDFGLARVKSDNQTMTKCGTRAWLAPEVLRGLRYDETADIFSYGIMMWEVFTRDRPYANMDPLKLNFELINGLRPTVPKSLNTQLAQLMTQCWDTDPKKRPSFDSIYRQLKQIH